MFEQNSVESKYYSARFVLNIASIMHCSGGMEGGKEKWGGGHEDEL